MKYIEEKYQQLIRNIESAYDDTCSTLKYHIDELKKMLAEKDDEIEKLKGASQLQKEIDEYNRLEAQNNMNLEDEITQLRAKLTEKDSDLKAAYDSIEAWETRFYTLVTEYGINLNRPVKKESVEKAKTRRKRSKIVVAHCKDCGTYFQAKSKLAKYCSACGKKRAKQSRLKWLAKQKGQK